MILREVFQHAKQCTLPKSWLYLPADAEWTLDTDGVFLDWENEEKDADEIPLVAIQRNLRETMDDGTIEQVVHWADRLAGREEESARLDVFRYYFRFDAFPEKLSAPDPPSTLEITLQLDREFYDSLGIEGTDSRCDYEKCTRGTIQFSVFCRIHHFERITKKPCPFQH